jgi:hypothetical protein
MCLAPKMPAPPPAVPPPAPLTPPPAAATSETVTQSAAAPAAPRSKKAPNPLRTDSGAQDAVATGLQIPS